MNFTIRDVAQLCGLSELNEKNGEYYCECPFCGDRRGKFSYVVEKGTKKNIFGCFKCGKSGNTLELYMSLNPGLYSGEDAWKQAIRDIEMRLDGKAPASFRSGSYADQAEKADADTIDRVYRIMLDGLTLFEEHKANLLKRGLTERQIEQYKFRSVPTPKTRRKFEQYVYSACKKQEIDPSNVPGLYYENGKLRVNMYTDGFLCPVYNHGKILGFQIRADNPKDGAKYTWLTSANKPKGVSAGSPMTYLVGKRKDIILITEGILKSEVVFMLLKGAVSLVGIAGVKIQSGLKNVLTDNPDAYVFEAFDADKHIQLKDKSLLEELKTKTQDPEELLAFAKEDAKYHDIEKALRIKKDAEHLVYLVTSYGNGAHSLNWDTDAEGYWKGRYKGLDDFLNEYPDPKVREDISKYMCSKADAYKKMKNFLQ